MSNFNYSRLRSRINELEQQKVNTLSDMTSEQAKEFLEQLRATRSELDYYKQTSNTKDGRLSQLDTQVKNFDQEKQKLTVSI